MFWVPAHCHLLWWRANAWKVSFETLNGGQFMLSTQLIYNVLNYLVILIHQYSITVSLDKNNYKCLVWNIHFFPHCSFSILTRKIHFFMIFTMKMNFSFILIHVCDLCWLGYPNYSRSVYMNVHCILYLVMPLMSKCCHFCLLNLVWMFSITFKISGPLNSWYLSAKWKKRFLCFSSK